MTLLEAFRSKAKCLSLRHAVILPAVLVLALHQLTFSIYFQPNVPVKQVLNSSPKADNVTRIYKEITFTNFGWFHPHDKRGLKVGRSWVAREFVDAVVVHDRYNQSAWEGLDQNPDLSRPILAFLDIDSCNDLHYPRFGQDWRMASDREDGRWAIRPWNISFARVCPVIERALQSPAMSAPESRLVVLSCEGDGPRIANCTSGDRHEELYSKLVVGHLSAHKDQVHRHDFGIPPMPVKSVALNETQLQDIQSCRTNHSRPYLFSFTGRPRRTFPQYTNYWKPRHGKDGVYVTLGFEHYKKNPNNVANAWGGKVLEALPFENQTQDTYYQLLTKSIFAGAPRGDNLYSVRFSEILSAAAIPVVYANGWVLPYTKDVVDWSELAVLLPERNVSQTKDILQSISERDVCRMQQRIVEFYKDYVADSHGRLRAVLKIMDARLNRASSHEITTFTAAPDRRR